MANIKPKLTKKLQVLLTEEEESAVNRIILKDAIETESRPISISAFIRELIQKEIEYRDLDKTKISKSDIKKIKPKK